MRHAELKAKQRQLREGFPQDLGLRVHRAISWIGRAEAETQDHDAAFVFLWIGFNAAYADGRSSWPSSTGWWRWTRAPGSMAWCGTGSAAPSRS